MKTQSKQVKNRSLYIALSFMALLVSSIGIISIYNDQTIKRNAEIKNQSREIIQLTQSILDNVKNLDLGIRGYALVREEGLLAPMHIGINRNKQSFRSIDSLLQLQNYDVTALYNLQRTVAKYEELSLHMATLLKNNDMDGFLTILRQDKGMDVWLVYKDFSEQLFAYENQLDQLASQAYTSAMYWNIVAQIILMLISLPTMGFVVHRIRQDARKRHTLFSELEANNRQYLFNPGNETELTDERTPIDNSITNFKNAVHFIQEISAGNYTVQWDGLTEQNAANNQQTLAGELANMREQMKKVKAEDEMRQWITEGLARFTEIIRHHQQDLAALSQEAVTFLVKYLGAQQGGLFIHRQEDNDQWLELSACYAFNRKKFVEKRTAIGQGLVGQTYLEAETVLLTEIPQGYTYITSGLGEETPSCLLLVPMKNAEKVVAVIELAGFVRYAPYQIQFVEKIGEIMAASILSAQTSEKTYALLEQTRMQAEQMQAQEEEMRQNLEEMAATQEEMHRREAELKQKLTEHGIM